MSNVKTRIRECANFLTAIWGLESEGLYVIVVVQTKPENSEESEWKTFPFKWPVGLKALLRRILSAEQEGYNVYICPALFSKPERAREHVAGSRVLWADFDGNAPETWTQEVPEPSIRIRTSYPGNQHTYWLLDSFLDDVDTLETMNRSIAQHLNADASGWDATQLLRPPGTTNRKNGLPVTLVSGLEE